MNQPPGLTKRIIRIVASCTLLRILMRLLIIMVLRSWWQFLVEDPVSQDGPSYDWGHLQGPSLHCAALLYVDVPCTVSRQQPGHACLCPVFIKKLKKAQPTCQASCRMRQNAFPGARGLLHKYYYILLGLICVQPSSVCCACVQ